MVIALFGEYPEQADSWGCILIDDGSSDGSEVECDKIAVEDSRFRVIHQKNSGFEKW